MWFLGKKAGQNFDLKYKQTTVTKFEDKNYVSPKKRASICNVFILRDQL